MSADTFLLFLGWSRRKMILGFFPLSLHSCFCSLSSRSGVNSSWPENIAARNCRILLVSNTFSRKWHFLSLSSVPALSLKALTSNKLGILSIFDDQRGLLVEKSIMLNLNVCGLEKQAATLHQINLKLFTDYFF